LKKAVSFSVHPTISRGAADVDRNFFWKNCALDSLFQRDKVAV
jgi:hypothetical protein